MTILIISIIAACVVLWLMIFKPDENAVRKWKELEPGTKLTNRRGRNYTIDSNGRMRTNIDVLFSDPDVQEQIHGFQQMFMRQTILALWQGKQPPHSVGGYGTLTKKKLIIEWNDAWQAEMDRLSDSYDLNYNILFGIPEEHPESGVVYTADEIVNQYGREEKNSS